VGDTMMDSVKDALGIKPVYKPVPVAEADATDYHDAEIAAVSTAKPTFNYKIKWDVMFPTKMSFIVWIIYMVLIINYGLITQWTKNDKGEYDYDPAVMMIIIEGAKLVISAGVTIYNNGLLGSLKIVVEQRKVLLLYTIPAGLYAIYNNLSFVNLRNYPPAVYSLFIEMKLILLGVFYQVVFQRKLSAVQWTSLFILTFSIILKQVDFSAMDSTSFLDSLKMNKFIWIIAQLVSSSFANVYNEFLLRKYSKDMDTWFQNVCNYFNGVNINLLIMFMAIGQTSTTGFANTFAALRTPHYLLILNQAFLGISAAFLLRYINSIVKSMCFPLVLIAQAIISYICFGIKITAITDYVAYALAMFAIYMYALNPIDQIE